MTGSITARPEISQEEALEEYLDKIIDTYDGIMVYAAGKIIQKLPPQDRAACMERVKVIAKEVLKELSVYLVSASSDPSGNDLRRMLDREIDKIDHAIDTFNKTLDEPARPSQFSPTSIEVAFDRIEKRHFQPAEHKIATEGQLKPFYLRADFQQKAKTEEADFSAVTRNGVSNAASHHIGELAGSHLGLGVSVVFSGEKDLRARTIGTIASELIVGGAAELAIGKILPPYKAFIAAEVIDYAVRKIEPHVDRVIMEMDLPSRVEIKRPKHSSSVQPDPDLEMLQSAIKTKMILKGLRLPARALAVVTREIIDVSVKLLNAVGITKERTDAIVQKAKDIREEIRRETLAENPELPMLPKFNMGIGAEYVIPGAGPSNDA